MAVKPRHRAVEFDDDDNYAEASTSTSSPSSSKGPRKGPSKSRSRDSRALKRQTEEQEIKDLASRVSSFTPPKDYDRFVHLPLSSRTAQGLKKAGFTSMTDIQAKSLPSSLQGKDVLGAARTGSGKTLAFLIPILETLYRAKWGPNDGLGALVISPTRELAIQIFEVLRKMGQYHTYSAGLVIGGKDVKQEKDRLSRMNILVATPGRLLQHMDQTVGFDCSGLQVLVLDEADRILDMGFANTLNAIVENLPSGRQTLLFSATQTKRVKDLARLSLKDPEYVAAREAVQDGAEGSSNGLTPRNLQQHYMVVSLEEKLNMLFSFLRTHTKSKMLIFFSSCREVQFAHETFCKLRPGLSLMALHGKQKQTKRLQIFTEYTRTQHAALFATDIAARGLDFPAVDWVIQVDAPEDVDTYVHRVGRTARYQAKGNSLLFLLPSEEEGMVARLAEKNITVNKIKPRESKTQSIQNQLQSFLFQSPELKYLAQKAFVSYVRSVHLQKDKSIFDVLALPLEPFAAALGLPGAPKVKFVREASAARKKAMYKEAAEAAVKANGDGAANADDATKVRTKYDRMFARQNQGVLSEHYSKLVADEDGAEAGESDDEADDDDGVPEQQSLIGAGEASDGDDDGDDADFMTMKRRDHALDDDDYVETPTDLVKGRALQKDDVPASSASKQPKPSAEEKMSTAEVESHLSKRKLQQGQSKKAMAASGQRGSGTKLTFDDDGVAHALYELQDEDDFRAGGTAADQARRFVEEEGERLKMSDVADKERVKEKKREKRRKEKARERGGDDGGVEDSEDDQEGRDEVLAPIDNRSDGYETPDFDLGSGSDDDSDAPPEAEQSTSKGRKRAGLQDELRRPPPKKAKRSKAQGATADSGGVEREEKKRPLEATGNLADDEAMALRLLAG